MADRAPAPPARGEVLRLLRDRLARGEEPLVVLAEGILGLEARIDLVARDPSGRVVIVSLAEPGEDLLRLADAVAQRSWVRARLPDWAQLAPTLGLRRIEPPRALLVAPHFDPRTLAAAEALGGDWLRLSICRVQRTDAGRRLLLEPCSTRRIPQAAEPAPASRFRTGLSADDVSPLLASA